MNRHATIIDVAFAETDFSMAQIDTFICGYCQMTFHDINLFIVHKNEQCVALSESATDQPLIYTEVHEEAAPQHQVCDQQETITVIQQVRLVSSALTAEFTLGSHAFCKIEVAYCLKHGHLHEECTPWFCIYVRCEELLWSNY